MTFVREARPHPSSPHGPDIVPQIHSTTYAPVAGAPSSSPGSSPVTVTESRSEPSIGPATSLSSPVMVTPARVTEGQPVLDFNVGVGLTV